MATLTGYWKRYKAISPWVAMASYVSTFVAWGILFLPDQSERALLAAAIIPFGIALDHFLHSVQTGKPNWQSALITSAIVTLLMPPDVNLGVAVLAVALAVASKHFLLFRRRHIFNPASFGVAVTALLFGYSLGWWPDSFLWLTLAFGLLNVWRVKKFPQVLAFTAVYLVLIGLVAGWPSGDLSFTDLGTQSLPLLLPYFFILFMLPEPVTSLDGGRRQVEFGALAGAIAVAVSFVDLINPAALLWGLLAANLYAAARR